MDSRDTLYVAYYGNSSSLIVKKYSGDTWEDVGSLTKAGFGASIAFDKAGTPYMSYIDEVSTDWSKEFYLNVVKYKDSNWVQIDRFKANSFKTGSFKTSIALDPSDTPYVYYTFTLSDSSDNSRTAVVKYEGEGYVRKDIDPQGNALTVPYHASFALDPDGVPYKFYISGSGGRVEKYTGSAWEPVGTTLPSVNPGYGDYYT